MSRYHSPVTSPTSIRIERKDLRATRCYAVLFTLLPLALGVGLYWVDGIIAKVGMVVCATLVIQSIRSLLGFAKSYELVGDRVQVEPLWSSKFEIHRGLIELVMVLEKKQGTGKLFLSRFSMKFLTHVGPVQAAAFPGCEKFVEALLRANCAGFTFPLFLEKAAMQRWTGSSDGSLGMAAAYRHRDGSLVTLHVLGTEASNSKPLEEIERSVESIAQTSAAKRIKFSSSETKKKKISDLHFDSVSVVVGFGSKAIRSDIHVARWRDRLLKVRVSPTPDGQNESPVESIVNAFLKENT